MVSLGFGKYVRSDRIYALIPLTGDERGDGRRTQVWIEGVSEPIIASRTEVTILRDMGQEAALARGGPLPPRRPGARGGGGPGRPQRPRAEGPTAPGGDHADVRVWRRI